MITFVQPELALSPNSAEPLVHPGLYELAPESSKIPELSSISAPVCGLLLPSVMTAKLSPVNTIIIH